MKREELNKIMSKIADYEDIFQGTDGKQLVVSSFDEIPNALKDMLKVAKNLCIEFGKVIY